MDQNKSNFCDGHIQFWEQLNKVWQHWKITAQDKLRQFWLNRRIHYFLLITCSVCFASHTWKCKNKLPYILQYIHGIYYFILTYLQHLTLPFWFFNHRVRQICCYLIFFIHQFDIANACYYHLMTTNMHAVTTALSSAHSLHMMFTKLYMI